MTFKNLAVKISLGADSPINILMGLTFEEKKFGIIFWQKNTFLYL
jgi:hypothetical protein